jgi:uncharacterized protein (DUF302 family)
MRIPALVLLAVSGLAQAASPPPATGGGYSAPAYDPNKNPYLEGTGGWIAPVQTPYGPILQQQALPPPHKDYGINRIISPEEKKRYLRMAMPLMANMMKMDAREAMNYFAVKYKAKPGLSFDDVVESLKLRANTLNFKFVGSNPMWKDFRAVLGDDTAPRVEVYSFCDIAVGRDLIRQIPEMAVFLPCRITVMEDSDKNIWIMTLDWDVTWLDYAGKSMGISDKLREEGKIIREKMDDMMRAAANGDL